MFIDVSAPRGKASFESEKVCSVRGTNGITKAFEYAFPRCIAPFKGTPGFFINVCKRRGESFLEKIFYDHLTWPEIKDMRDEDKVVVQMIGSIEQHRPHLPLCTDTAPKAKMLRRALLKASEKMKVFMAPPIPRGYSRLKMDIPGPVDRYPGTLTLSPETIFRLIRELCDCSIRANFRKILLLSCHGGNY